MICVCIFYNLGLRLEFLPVSCSSTVQLLMRVQDITYLCVHVISLIFYAYPHICVVAVRPGYNTNVTITSDGSNNTAHVVCHNVTAPTSGLAFINMTHLTLNNLHFSHCGGILSSESVSSINESRIYFPPGQAAVLVFNRCHHLTMHNVSVDGRYYGYAVIAANVYGNVDISHVSVTDSLVCTEQQVTSSVMCSGSGLLFMFIDIENNVLDESINSNHTLLNNVLISNNANHYPHINVNPIALLQYGGSRVAVFGAGGLTVLFNVGTAYHNGRFIIQYSGLHENYGLSGGCLIVYYNILGLILPSFSFTTCFFSKNAPVVENINGYGGGLAVYVISSHSQVTEVSKLNITFHEVEFIQHTALYGGGVYMLLPCSKYIHTNVTFSTVLWRNNEAKAAGAVVYIESDCVSGKAESCMVDFIDMKLYYNGKNMIHQCRKLRWLTKLSLLEFTSIGRVIFRNMSTPSTDVHDSSSGPTVIATDTDIVLRGSIIFQDIRSVDPVAFSLKELSHLIIEGPTIINFLHPVTYPYSSMITALGRPYGGYRDCPLQFINHSKVNTTAYDKDLYINCANLALGTFFYKDLYVIYSDGFDKCDDQYYSERVHLMGTSIGLVS